MKRTRYMIQHTPSGRYLPESKRGRGYTRDRLVEPDDYLPPRTFVSRAAAKRALTWWVRGPCRGEYESEYVFGVGTIKYCSGPTKPSSKAARRRQKIVDEMAVVPIIFEWESP